MTDELPAVVACDESGSEGENLMDAAHPDFVHGSVHLDLDEAEVLIDKLRQASRSQASELKSSTALAPRVRASLISLVSDVAPNANICLVDKEYYTCAKLIDLLVVEEAHERGVELAFSGYAATLAQTLQSRASAALGPYVWRELLLAFNQLARTHNRKGASTPGPELFFTILDVARSTCADLEVAEILDLVWEARHHVIDQGGDQGVPLLREMDPMVTTLNAIVRTWGVRLQGAPFDLLVDTYWALSDEIQSLLVRAADISLPVGGIEYPTGDLRGIKVADSRSDARIQIADVMAGVGREVARLARDGVYDDPLQIAAHEALDFNGMWALGSPLDVLSDRRPLRYFDRWVRERQAGEQG